MLSDCTGECVPAALDDWWRLLRPLFCCPVVTSLWMIGDRCPSVHLTVLSSCDVTLDDWRPLSCCSLDRAVQL